MLDWLFKRGENGCDAGEKESFAARFHRFKLFLSAHLEAYSEIMTFEERLAQEQPLGMPFLRICTARLTVASMQCVLQLNLLGKGHHRRLEGVFSSLRSGVQDILAQGLTPLEGPLLVSYDALSEEHAAIVSPILVKLRAIRDAFPQYMPRGFVVTGAAWWNYFNDPDMHDEIDRIMLISREDPSSYSEAAATIRERILSSFPLPPELEAAIRDMLDKKHPEWAEPGHMLLVRCLPVRLEHAALVMPEQILRTPLTAEDLLLGIRSSLTMAYRTRSLIYRLKRGIRDRAMPVCISITRIPETHGRGSAHRALEETGEDDLALHVRRGFSVPENWPSQASVEGAFLPPAVQKKVRASVFAALECLADAPVRGNRHEIFWAVSEQGDFYVLGVNALPDPVLTPEKLQKAAALAKGAEVLRGGRCTYPGLVRAKAFPVRNFVDALTFPVGSILVLRRATPRWSFLLDFASGAVCGDGTGNGLFARTARRYGRPCLLRQPEAFARLNTGEPVRLAAGGDESVLWADAALEGQTEREGNPPAALPEEEALFCAPVAPIAGAGWPLEFSGSAPPQWLPDSDIARMARHLAPAVVALTLPDADHVDFRAENCRTFRDILSYCHVHAVKEMFHAGTARKGKEAPAKQLVCDVPKQFWIINLDDGFFGEVRGPVVPLESIACLPMRSFWEGFTDKPWEGPPPLNAKGFLSVLFEATANPSLDPASQSSQYTEKNVFLIARRFCSMRCRFGFHFLSLDCLLGERERERFLVFQFKGGAADLSRRIKRVHFVAELLAQFDFATEITGDILSARLEQSSEEKLLSAVRVLGYLVMHTRQLDMIMDDDRALSARRFQMLEDMLTLASRPPLQL